MDNLETKQYTYEEARAIVIKNGNLFENGYPTEISDYEFDGLVNLIKKVDPNFDFRDYVKYESDGKEVKHSISFRDFEKNYDIDNYQSPDTFQKLNEQYVVTPKFDGSSIVSYYNEGQILKILSKSDKEWGFVNTNKLLNKATAMKNRVVLPIGKEWNDVLGVCCEAVVNKENGGRSKANGLINSKYLQDDVDKYLELMPWDIVFKDGTRECNRRYELNRDQFEEIRTTGFLNIDGLGLIPCDGVVCYPRNGDEKLFIQKIYSLEEKQPEVTNITWDPSDYGLYHPVAEYDTVVFESDGKENSRVNMSNIDLMYDRKVAPGTIIKVGMAGSTIPAYIDTVSAKDGWEKYYATDENGCYGITCECGAKLKRCGDSSDLICSSNTCGWWFRTFKYRLLQNVLGSELTDDIVAALMMEKPEELVTLNAIKTAKGINSWNDYIYKDVDTYFNMVQIQRVSDAKYENMKKSWEARASGEKVLDVMGMYMSDKQWDYAQEVDRKLTEFVKHIS